jgi:hypothetical protein
VRLRAPRAKRSSARGWLGRLSGWPLGPPGPWAREFILRMFWVRLCFVFLRRKAGFPWSFRGPLRLSPTRPLTDVVAQEAVDERCCPR